MFVVDSESVAKRDEVSGYNSPPSGFICCHDVKGGH